MTPLALAATIAAFYLAAVLLGRWIAPDVRVEICADCKVEH